VARIVGEARQPHPQRIHRGADIDDLQNGPGAHRRMAPIGANDKIGADGQLAICCRGPQPGDLRAFEEQVGYLGLHFELEVVILLGVLGDKVQKIPLRHHGDEAAARWQMRKICELDEILTNLHADRPRWLMRPPEKFLEKAELVHDFERGGVDRIAPEIA